MYLEQNIQVLQKYFFDKGLTASEDGDLIMWSWPNGWIKLSLTLQRKQVCSCIKDMRKKDIQEFIYVAEHI
jgi:hypothetical protein